MNLGRAIFTITLLGASSVLCARNLAAEYRQNDQQNHADQNGQVEHRQFDEHDRQLILEWFRGHADRLEPASSLDRWSHRDVSAYLRVDSVLDEDTRTLAGPMPAKLASQLRALPRGWRYVMLGYNICIVDAGWTIRDVFHFDPFEERDRDAIEHWSRDHPNALSQRAGGGVQVDNANVDRLLQVGTVLAADLRAEARAAPEDLVSRLSAVPVDWRYVVIGDRLCLVDEDWRLHEAFPLRSGNTSP